MSKTRITIVKAAGRLSEAIGQLFQRRAGTAESNEELEWSLNNAQVSDRSICEEILPLTHALEQHCDCDSVVWFQQFVDAWTIAPCRHAIDDFESLAGQFKVILSDSVDVLLLAASDREVARFLKARIVYSRNQRGYSPERLYFLKQLRYCAASWQPFLESNKISTIKMVVFHALGPSRLDRDIIRASKSIPDWFQELYSPKERGEEKRV